VRKHKSRARNAGLKRWCHLCNQRKGRWETKKALDSSDDDNFLDIRLRRLSARSGGKRREMREHMGGSHNLRSNLGE